MLVGLCHLRTFFGTYEQFISVFWNDFLIGYVRKFLWNVSVSPLSFQAVGQGDFLMVQQ